MRGSDIWIFINIRWIVGFKRVEVIFVLFIISIFLGCGIVCLGLFSREMSV